MLSHVSRRLQQCNRLSLVPVLMLLVGIQSLAVIVNGAATAAFPATVERCHYGDGECLAKTFTEVLQKYPQGIPELGLVATDPLYYGNITVSQDGGGPVSMKLSLKDSSILGWSKGTVTKVIGFDKDPRTSKFGLHMQVPFDQIVGKYEMNGKLLLIGVRGAGDGKMQFTDLAMKIKFHTSVETRDNEDYLKLDKVTMDITCKRMHNNFDNLFKDKAISDNVNNVLNESQELIFNEMRKEFGVARGKIVRNLLNPMFQRFPYRMLFAEETPQAV